jgi:hypothetical protein
MQISYQPTQMKSPTLNFNVSLTSAQTFVDILNKDKEEDAKKEVENILPIVYQSDTLLYIVNYLDNKGWLVISGDKRTSMILSYSDEGSLDIDNLTNPGVGIWLDDLAEQIYALKHRETIASDTLSENYSGWLKIEEFIANTSNLQTRQLVTGPESHWELINVSAQIVSTTTTGPLLTTKWGQGPPWNACVPNSKDYTTRCPTGCVAVSGAQIFYYLHNRLDVPASTYSSGYCNGWSDEQSGIWNVIFNNSCSYSFGFSDYSTTTWGQNGQIRNI